MTPRRRCRGISGSKGTDVDASEKRNGLKGRFLRVRLLPLLFLVSSVSGCNNPPEKAQALTDEFPPIETYADSIPAPWKVVDQDKTGIRLRAAVPDLHLRRYPEYAEFWHEDPSCVECLTSTASNYITVGIRATTKEDLATAFRPHDWLFKPVPIAPMDNDIWHLKVYSTSETPVAYSMLYYYSNNDKVQCRDTGPIEAVRNNPGTYKRGMAYNPPIQCDLYVDKDRTRVGFWISSFDRQDLPKMISIAVDLASKVTRRPNSLLPEES